MLEGRKDQARERVTAFEKHKYIQWLTESPPERLNNAAAKKRAWIKTDFAYHSAKLWRQPSKGHFEQREVITENLIWDTESLHTTQFQARGGSRCRP